MSTYGHLTIVDPSLVLAFSAALPRPLDERDLVTSGFTIVKNGRTGPHGERHFNRLYGSATPDPITATDSSEHRIIGLRSGPGSDPVIAGTLAEHLPLSIRGSLRMYPSEFCAIRLTIRFEGGIEVPHLNAFINGSLDGTLLWELDGWDEPTDCEDVVQAVAGKAVHSSVPPGGSVDAITCYESFSVIDASGVNPPFDDASQYLSPEWERSMFEAAIRRIPNFAEIELRVPRERQRNLSSYSGDLVFLNYHHLFVYVVERRGHLASDFYVDVAESVKVLTAFLYALDVRTHDALARLEALPAGLRALRKESEELEDTRLAIMRALDSFHILTAESASRAKWFLSAATTTFGVEELRSSVLGKVHDIDAILSNRYSLAMNRTLQTMAIVIGVLSMMLAIVPLLRS